MEINFRPVPCEGYLDAIERGDVDTSTALVDWWKTSSKSYIYKPEWNALWVVSVELEMRKRKKQ